MKTKRCWLVLLLVALASLPQTVRAAVSLAVAPSSVSNTYSGQITLQVGGLTNTEKVVIQKFLDLNTNGVIDGGDLLVQQFNLTDGQAGMVIGGVTNLNVPGDVNFTAGAITAKLNFQTGDFLQNVAGKYLFRLSSPVGHFGPLTNPFAVTNLPYPQMITGNVVSNKTSTTITNAVVVLLEPPRPGHDGPGTPLAGVVANNAGGYAIRMPPGMYRLMVFGSNYVLNFSAPPLVTLAAGQTVTTNPSLTRATSSISGKLADASDTSVGLPGVWVFGFSAERQVAFTCADSNGNFNLRVTSGQWSFDTLYGSISLHGYLGWYNNPYYSACAGASGIIVAYPKADALFYGRMTNDLGNPLAGLAVDTHDDNEVYYTETYTDTNGDYVLGALSGAVDDPWEAHAETDINPNYVYSYPISSGTAFNPGDTIRQDFTAIPANNRISGTLQDDTGQPVAGVGIWANGDINGLFYHVYSVETDTNGFYSFNVCNGTWYVGGFVDLPDIYSYPSDEQVDILNNDAVVNFTVVLPINHITGFLGDEFGDPIEGADIFASTEINGTNYVTPRVRTDIDGLYSLDVPNGTWNVDVAFPPLSPPYLKPSSQEVAVFGFDGVADFTAVTATSQISGSVRDGGGQPVVGIEVQANGYSVDLFDYFGQSTVTDSGGNYSLNAVDGIWTVGLGASPAPYINPGDQIIDIPGSDTVVNFTVVLTGGGAQPTLSSPAGPSDGQFQFLVNGVGCQNYTVEMSTNLSQTNWATLLITNTASSDVFTVVDPNATNTQRFYRVLVGP